MQHSPVAMGYAGFQAAKNMQQHEDFNALSKYLGKSFPLADSSTSHSHTALDKSTLRKNPRSKSALGLRSSSSRPETLASNAAITIVPKKGAFATKKMGLLCKCCGHMLSTHFTDMDLGGASSVLASSPSLVARRGTSRPKSAPSKQKHRKKFAYYVNETSLSAGNSTMLSGDTTRSPADFSARSNLLWEIRRSLMDEYSPIQKTVARDLLRQDDGKLLVEELQGRIRDLEAQNSVLHAKLQSSEREASEAREVLRDSERDVVDLREQLARKEAEAAVQRRGSSSGQELLMAQLKDAQGQHIQSLQRQVEDLNGKLREALQQLSVTLEAKAKAEQGRGISEAELQRVKAMNAQMEQQLEESRGLRHELQNQEQAMRESEQLRSKYRAEIDKYRAEIDALKKQLHVIASQQAPKQETSPRVAADCDKEEMASLERVALRLKADKLELQQEISKQQVRLSSLDEQRIELESRLALLEGAHRETGRLKEVVRVLEMGKAGLESQLGVTQKEVEELHKKLRQVESDHKRVSEVCMLQEEESNSRHQQEVLELMRAIARLEREAAELGKEANCRLSPVQSPPGGQLFFTPQDLKEMEQQSDTNTGLTFFQGRGLYDKDVAHVSLQALQGNRPTLDEPHVQRAALQMSVGQRGGKHGGKAARHDDQGDGSWETDESVLRFRFHPGAVCVDRVYAEECWSFERSLLIDKDDAAKMIQVVSRPSPKQVTPRHVLEPVPARHGPGYGVCGACGNERILRRCHECYPGLPISASGNSLC